MISPQFIWRNNSSFKRKQSLVVENDKELMRRVFCKQRSKIKSIINCSLKQNLSRQEPNKEKQRQNILSKLHRTENTKTKTLDCTFDFWIDSKEDKNKQDCLIANNSYSYNSEVRRSIKKRKSSKLHCKSQLKQMSAANSSGIIVLWSKPFDEKQENSTLKLSSEIESCHHGLSSNCSNSNNQLILKASDQESINLVDNWNNDLKWNEVFKPPKNRQNVNSEYVDNKWNSHEEFDNKIIKKSNRLDSWISNQNDILTEEQILNCIDKVK